MKLKTLKDIKKFKCEPYTSLSNLDPHYFTFNIARDEFEKRIKKEAIKWIKELAGKSDLQYLPDYIIPEGNDYCLNCQKQVNLGTCEEGHIILSEGYEESDITGTILFVCHFFNITEEDLKDE